MTTEDQSEYEVRKKGVFDSMSKRGQERILRIGYEKWDPFQEPKDPRELIFSSTSMRANALVREFYEAQGRQEDAPDLHKDLFDLCRGALKGERRAKTIMEFCTWFRQRKED